MNARKLVAYNLRRLRVAQQLSQEALAADADVDRAYVSRLERGLENPTVNVLEKLSIALTVDISEFFRSTRANISLKGPNLRAGRKRL